MNEKYIVEGYEFDTLEDANVAKKELEAVKFMSKKTNGCSPEAAYKIYTKIIDAQMFKTAIGYDYLRALEEYLIVNGMFNVPSFDMEEINNYHKEAEQLEKENETQSEEVADNPPVKKAKKKKEKKVEEQLKSARDWLKTSLIFNVLLIIGMAVMIYIASTSQNVNILNYETALQDKYASWAKELKEKEELLKEREKALEQQNK